MAGKQFLGVSKGSRKYGERFYNLVLFYGMRYKMDLRATNILFPEK